MFPDIHLSMGMFGGGGGQLPLELQDMAGRRLRGGVLGLRQRRLARPHEGGHGQARGARLDDEARRLRASAGAGMHIQARQTVGTDIG